MIQQSTHQASNASHILVPEDGPAFEVTNDLGESRVILVCEHASNRVPISLDSLGLTDEQLRSHVAWDPGASDLSHDLSSDLDATLIEARFSRLVYDLNRPPEAISAMPSKTEVCFVPGNDNIDATDRVERTSRIYVPFHAELSRIIAMKRAMGTAPIIVTVHSFTPVFKGVEREVEIGLLHGNDGRLAHAMLENSASNGKYDVRLNEPYAASDGVMHSIEKQLDDADIPHVMIEVRNDLLADQVESQKIATFLSQSIAQAVSNLNSPKQFNAAGNN
jgi:predicted N-formylglutamate amidohydrolase